MAETYTVGVGDSGWVRVSHAGMENILHVRFALDGDRLRIAGLHLSAKRGAVFPLTGAFNTVAFARIESLVNAYFSDEVRARLDRPSPDLPLLLKELTDKPSRSVRSVDREFRLTEGPTSGLTDAFLGSVRRAYEAAVARGERPNVSISSQLDVPLKTVQRWVYTARQRGIMHRRVRQGAAG